jgi:hypothetical protein
MFPNDAITESFELTTPATLIVTDPGEYTILNVSLNQQNNNSPVRVECGNALVWRSYNAGISNIPISYNCENQVIEIIKTGSNPVFASITYVPYLLDNVQATSSVGYNPSTEISSSSDVQVYGSISAGEFIISLFLLTLVLFKVMELIAKGLSKFSIKRKYLKYGGGDVPVVKE